MINDEQREADPGGRLNRSGGYRELAQSRDFTGDMDEGRRTAYYRGWRRGADWAKAEPVTIDRGALVQAILNTRCIVAEALESKFAMPIRVEAERMADAVIAHLSERQNHTENGAVVTPDALPDGTLALPCGSLWSVADREAWRVDHLPGCAICKGNFA